jgi:hypothetical protein
MRHHLPPTPEMNTSAVSDKVFFFLSLSLSLFLPFPSLSFLFLFLSFLSAVLSNVLRACISLPELLVPPRLLQSSPLDVGLKDGLLWHLNFFVADQQTLVDLQESEFETFQKARKIVFLAAVPEGVWREELQLLGSRGWTEGWMDGC